ncbi:hypothetical protein NDU88_001213 [Pleurodeles waltl]|uniref:Uncharacterized protein n=1 Tax=Pleurodeles waltl TaxID=8319 RepID=A0AAV7LY22_PLEWA|nr:hypothetical protein NDU88_001213 [Pleurodeles waltl]
MAPKLLESYCVFLPYLQQLAVSLRAAALFIIQGVQLVLKLRIVVENKSHFFTTPEAAWEWIESTGRASGCTAERIVPVLRSKRNRVRRGRKRGDMRAETVTHAPDLEQLIQERREAIHSAAAIVPPRWHRSLRLKSRSHLVIDLSHQIDFRSWASPRARP